MNTSYGGGVAATPSVPGLGEDQWAAISGANPASPLITGHFGSPGYGQTRIASAPNVQAARANGTPGGGHWTQLFDLSGNPLGWILLMFLAFMAIHFAEHHGRRRGR
jgi:hypothetical protein